jgi:hypothetical protein
LTTKLLGEYRRNDKKIIQEKLQNQLENEINEMNQIDQSNDKSKKNWIDSNQFGYQLKLNAVQLSQAVEIEVASWDHYD